MAQDVSRLVVRIPLDLKAKLDQFSEVQGRSLNSTILKAIEHYISADTVPDTMPDTKPNTMPDLEKLVSELEEKIVSRVLAEVGK